MSNFKFAVINPLLHSELRLKIMVALDSLESADFMYLCQITDSTRGNLSTQITTLKDAGYIDVSKTGIGRFSRTTCSITASGRKARANTRAFFTFLLFTFLHHCCGASS